jgi:signal transduction histidine kinase
LFLDEVLEIIEIGRGSLAEEGGSPIARGHGGQRQLLNSSIGDLVQEYYLFLESATELADEKGATLNQRGLLEFTKWLFSGTASAVGEFIKRQELQRRQSDFEYFAFVAHELRNPLSSTKMAWELLVRKGQLDARRVEVVHRGLRQLTELIDHSITRSRIQSGVEVRREPVALDNLVADARADSVVDAETKTVQIAAQASGLTVLGDYRLLRSALTNLLRNAVKFTREGGSIAISGRLSEGRVLIEVEDECGGLPPERAEKLFTAFEQADKDRSGFGLGLAISKQAIEAHSGTLSVKDVPGKGCVFTIDLPNPDEDSKGAKGDP